MTIIFSNYMTIFYGILLGWGAAIPFGPINIEITRRNLNFGTAYGVALGLGACIADLTYILLLGLGILFFLTYPLFLNIVGLLGASILAWFGYQALKLPSKVAEQNRKVNPAILRSSLDGFLLTMINPFTILFWSSISAQVATLASQHESAIIYASLGVVIGAASWIILLNTVLHYTKHKLSAQFTQRLNYIGGIILLAFALIGFVKSGLSFFN